MFSALGPAGPGMELADVITFTLNSVARPNGQMFAREIRDNVVARIAGGSSDSRAQISSPVLQPDSAMRVPSRPCIETCGDTIGLRLGPDMPRRRAAGACRSSSVKRLVVAAESRSSADAAELHKLRGLAFKLAGMRSLDSGTAIASQPLVMDHQNQRTLLARSASGANGNTPRAAFAKHGDGFGKPGAGAGRPAIDPEEFERFLEHAASLRGEETRSLRSWLELAEAWQITKVLRHCRGNRSATARELGIGRRTLYAKMEKLGITASWGV